jgi:protein-S-isoprenylcysteine O-methyltransferase Ste14
VIWVVTQTALMVSIVVSWFFPPWITGDVARIVAIVMLAAGGVLIVTTRLAMGRSFTVLPKPRAEGELVTGGPFRVVRHPTYLGFLLCLAGGSLLHSWTGLALTGALAILWAGKARVEERYLEKRFPEYDAYRSRVRYRIVPLVY